MIQRYTGLLSFLKIGLGDASGQTSASRQRRVLRVFLGLMALPAILSPTHPIAVYGYLAMKYSPTASTPVHAATEHDLSAFLITPAQVDRYRVELWADMANRNSGGLFAIVRNPDGTLSHAPIRTWNAFLPASTPDRLSRWLDQKEFSFLGDHVALWLEGQRIVAMGHYHAFGGGPSAGDIAAQRFSDHPEIVVSNGITPLVYLDGDLVPYGDNVQVTNDVFRSMRALERALTMDVQDPEVMFLQPSPGLNSFLAYLRDYRGVNIEERQAIAMELKVLCHNFQEHYHPLFEQGFKPHPNAYDPDRASVSQNVTALYSWAGYYGGAGSQQAI